MTRSVKIVPDFTGSIHVKYLARIPRSMADSVASQMNAIAGLTMLERVLEVSNLGKWHCVHCDGKVLC